MSCMALGTLLGVREASNAIFGSSKMASGVIGDSNAISDS